MRRFWTLARFEDVRAVLENPALFTSSGGVSLIDNEVEKAPPLLVSMDGARHSRLRKVASRAFRPRRIAQLEGMIARASADVLDGLPRSAEIDFVGDYATRFPAAVMADLLGLPREDLDRFRRWSGALIEATSDPSLIEPLKPTLIELTTYLLEAIADRRENPSGDLLSDLRGAEQPETEISEEEVLGLCFTLLAAGAETTTNLLSNAVALLAEDTEQRELASSSSEFLAQAIEEVARLESPIQNVRRTTTRAVELHNHQIEEGEKVLLLLGAANRDESVFVDASRFFIQRETEVHLGFGFGAHYCLGATLARLEARVGLAQFLRKYPHYKLASGALRKRSPIVRGYSRLPILVSGI